MDIPTTPAPSGRFKFMFRSILREQNTPGTGQSVRWGARNAFRTITPETSAEGVAVPSTPLLEDEDHTSFLDRLANESSDDRSPTGRERIEQLAAQGQSVGSRLTGPTITTTPPTPGPAPLSNSTAPPIPRPRFGAPSSSSPLARDDSSLLVPHSMSPAQDYSISHKPFDMSRDLDAIPLHLANESMATTGGEEDDTRFYSNAGDLSHGAIEDARPTPNDTARGGMTTRYPPGMFNLTKTQQRIPSFSIEPDTSGERTRMSLSQTRARDTTGSSSLDFITASAGSGRSSLPPAPGPKPDFDPPPLPAHSRSLSASYSNLLSRATTTAPPREMLSQTTTEIPTRELPTIYPPGYARFNQTTVVHVDPENIPELTRFFTPTLGEKDVDITRVSLGHESYDVDANQSDTRAANQSNTLASNQSNTIAAETSLPASPPLSLSASSPLPLSSSGSSLSSQSLATPTDLSDLSLLIESQYKADLAAHAALVPILLSRAESAESSARRLAGVVKDTRARVKELEMLCIELGEEVGVLREERSGFSLQLGAMRTERSELVAQVADLSLERDEVGQGGLDAATEEALQEMHDNLRRAEIEAARSRRRKDERDVARSVAKDLEKRVREMEVRERDWEVRVERERDGQGARERVKVEKEGWEKERMELLDRCVRAEEALSDGPVIESGDAKLRKELENYKAEVKAQWSYAEQAEESRRKMEEELKALRAQLRESRSSSPRSSTSRSGSDAREAEWRTKELQWKARETEWERERQEWVPTRRYAEIQAEILDLQAERDALSAQAGDMEKMEGELEKMAAELDKADSEMAVLTDRARHAEEMYVAAQKEVDRADARIKELEGRSRSPDQRVIRRLELEREEMVDALKDAEDRLRQMETLAEELESRCVKAEEERKDVLRDRAEVEEELERLRVQAEDGTHVRNEVEQERNAIAEELVSEQEVHAALAAEHDRIVLRLEEVERERLVALENQERLEGVVRTRNQEIAEVEERLLAQSRETEQLRADRRELEKVKVQRDDAIQAEEHLRAQRTQTESVELRALRDKVSKLTDETGRLRQRVNELKSESADKEVKIVQLNKARAQEAEDKEGLNIALQSKQQELELIKRKLGVRGTAGATPAPGRVQRSSFNRRESTASSAAFETPMPRAAMALRDVAPPSESTASVLSSSVSSNLHSISTNPLQTSTRANIYDAMSSTPATIKPARRTSDYVPRPSLRGMSSLSVSGIRGVHFAPSEQSETETEESDVTIQQV